MGRITIGTSGYSYKDWVGPYYPAGTKPSEFLSYYACDFSITELNFTYYTLPRPRTFDRLLEKTPEEFRFVVKAHGSMTHDRDESWKENTRRFREAVTPLAEAGRLAGILLQFPYSFRYTARNRRYLAALCEEVSSFYPHPAGHAPGAQSQASQSATASPDRLGATGGAPASPAVPLFVEYRHTEWQRTSVYEEMRKRKLTLVIPDMPRLRGLPSSTPVITADRGYLRFHGRNAEQWWHGDNRSRYDYLYGKEELREWLGPIKSLAGDLTELFVMFNNHANAQAVINAKTLAQMLTD